MVFKKQWMLLAGGSLVYVLMLLFFQTYAVQAGNVLGGTMTLPNTYTYTIYNDLLVGNWHDWSNANVDLIESAPVYSGHYSASFKASSRSKVFYLHNSQAIATINIEVVRLAVYATASNQKYGISLVGNNDNTLGTVVPLSLYGGKLLVNQWKVYSIPMTAFRANKKPIKGIKLQNLQFTRNQVVYIDAVQLVTNSSITPMPTSIIQPTVTKPPTATVTPVKNGPSPTPTRIIPTPVKILPTPTKIAPTSTPRPIPTVAPGTSWWKPTTNLPIHWHWQLSHDFVYPRDVVAGATVYDIDGEKATADTVAKLHALGPNIKVICYFDGGVYESYRSDASSFPSSVIGSKDVGWDGSNWLDIRQQSIILPIMQKRMVNWCKNKGFDAVEPDETEVWSNNSGFPITKAQNNDYNQKIAAMAHSLGLSVGLKGNTTEAPELWPYFDFSINEQCWQYKECNNLQTSFLANNKAVFNIEYSANPNCTLANAMHMNSAKRDLNLMAPSDSSYKYQPCVANNVNNW